MSDSFFRLVAGLQPSRMYEPPRTPPRVQLRNRFVLATLAWLADEDGRCVVDTPKIAAIVGEGNRVAIVRHSLQALESLGFVQITTQTTEQGGCGPHVYQLQRDALEAKQYRK